MSAVRNRFHNYCFMHIGSNTRLVYLLLIIWALSQWIFSLSLSSVYMNCVIQAFFTETHHNISEKKNTLDRIYVICFNLWFFSFVFYFVYSSSKSIQQLWFAKNGKYSNRDGFGYSTSYGSTIRQEDLRRAHRRSRWRQ